MNDPWQRILAWVEAHAPDLLDFLEPAADRADLAEAERRLSMRLPAARAFYGLQNGTTAFAVFPALDAEQSAFGPLPLDEIEFLEPDEDEPRGRRRRGEPEEEFEADPGVRPEFWHPNWIPFAATLDRGDFLLLDFALARGGRIGQVIEWRHDTNEPSRRAILEHLLTQTADGLESGTYVWDEQSGIRRTFRR